VLATPGDTAVTIHYNRVPTNVELCPPSASTVISSPITGSTYQWQMSTDSVNFTNVSNGGYYGGANSSVLQLTGIPSSMNGFQFRCLTNGNPGYVWTIQFKNTWTGSSGNNLWSNAANWSCGTLPDANTDVYIPAGRVVINSNVTVRTLEVAPTATVTVATGVTLTVLK